MLSAVFKYYLKNGSFEFITLHKYSEMTILWTVWEGKGLFLIVYEIKVKGTSTYK